MRRLAIIPARGGSKRIPRKNIRSFLGRPMISYILETAKLSGLFDTIHVSTEDHEIYQIVNDIGYKPQFERPSSISQDSTPIMPVLKHATQHFEDQGDHFEAVWLLMACAPLIEPTDLIEAEALFASTNYQSPILGVTEYNVPIEWAFKMDNTKKLSPLYPGMFSKNSDEMESKYHDAGVFAAFPTKHVLNSKGAGNDEMFVGFNLSPDKAVDIDTEKDWELAEALYRIKNQIC